MSRRRGSAAHDDGTALPRARRRPGCGRPASEGSPTCRGAVAARALDARLLVRVHLAARGRRPRSSLQLLRKLALKLSVDEEYLARGVARVEQTPAELVAAEVARRLGDFDLAREHYETVLEATSAPAARERAARQLARLRGETLDEEQDERELVPGGLEDPAERARSSGSARGALDDEGDRQGAARYARDALALLDYAEDRRLAGAETEIADEGPRARRHVASPEWSTVHSDAAGSRSRASSSAAATSAGSAPRPRSSAQGETEAEAHAIMDAAWAAGITTFDTADAYGGGRSETLHRQLAALKARTCASGSC